MVIMISVHTSDLDLDLDLWSMQGVLALWRLVHYKPEVLNVCMLHVSCVEVTFLPPWSLECICIPSLSLRHFLKQVNYFSTLEH